MDVASAVKSLLSPTTAVSSTASGPKQDTTVTPAVEQLAPKSEKTDANVKPNEAAASVIELRLAPEKSEIRVGEKRQVSVEVKSDAPLGLAVVTMRFDPHVIKISGVSPGKIFANLKTAPTLSQSTDQNGMLLVSLSPAAGSSVIGEGGLLSIDIEAIGAGDSALAFDISNVHLVAADGRPTALQLGQGSLTVKPADKQAPEAPKPNPNEISADQPLPKSQDKPGATTPAVATEENPSGKPAVTNQADNTVNATVNDQHTAGTSKTYTIKKWDSLWRIAKQQGVSIAALRTANPGLRMLLPGRQLVIP